RWRKRRLPASLSRERGWPPPWPSKPRGNWGARPALPRWPDTTGPSPGPRRRPARSRAQVAGLRAAGDGCVPATSSLSTQWAPRADPGDENAYRDRRGDSPGCDAGATGDWEGAPMIGQEDPPGFEDLEPEGKEVERYPSLENGNGQEFETLAADDAPMGSAGLDDPDEDEAFASLDDGLERLDDRFPRRSPANGFHSSPPSGRQTAGRLQGGRVGEGAGGVAALAKDDELMLALAAAAALAESRAEAERLVVALVPLSLRLVPAVSRALWPSLPALIEGAAGLTRLLYAHPETR